MAKDANEALAAGVPIDDLIAAADASEPVAPSDLGKAATDGVKHLKAILSQLEKVRTDVRAQAGYLTQATAQDRFRFILGAALHVKRDEVLPLLASLRPPTTDRQLRPQVDALEELMALKAEAIAGSAADRAERKENKRTTTLLEATLRGLGLTNLRLPAGYQMDPDGVRTDDGAIICTQPVLITGVFKDPATRILKVEVAWRDGGVWQKLLVARSIVANSRTIVSLSDLGIPVTSGTANVLVQYLAAFEAVNKDTLMHTIASGTLGWVNDKSFLYGSEAVGDYSVFAEDENNRQYAKGFEAKGTWEGWCDTIRCHVVGRPLVMVAIYTACASLLLKPLGLNGFVVDWSGLTSVGKTTALRAAASAIGIPDDSGDGLVRSWAGTKAAKMYIASVLQSFPLILDDTKRQTDHKLIAAMLYDHPAGQNSDRANTDGKARVSARWRSIMMSTGEAPITSFTKDGGAHARALCLRGSPWGDISSDNARSASLASRAFMLNYGHMGRRFVQRILATPNEELRSRYSVFLARRDEDSGVQARLNGYVAVVELAAVMCHELGMPGHAEDNLHVLGDTLKMASDSSDMPKMALEALFRWAAGNYHNFWNPERAKQKPPQGGWLGRWDMEDRFGTPDGMRAEYVGFNPEVAVRQLSDWGYDAPSCLNAWKERGWLLLDRYKANPQRGPKNTRVICVQMDVLRPPKDDKQ
jgi:hypothetical protein